MFEGIITKGYSGFYYVQSGTKLWECSLRGRFRLLKQDFLPGDRVKVSPVNGDKGVIEEVLPRTNSLVRPTIANVDQAVIVLAVQSPDPDFNLLDRILIQVEAAQITPVICFNKVDRLSAQEVERLIQPYRQAEYCLLHTSAILGQGIAELRGILRGKISVFAGPSGVGKSSLLNALQPGLELKTGEVSRKLRRGRHTTRHVELIPLADGGLVADTPGFSSLNLPSMQKEELVRFFPEMEKVTANCKFTTCLHKQEPQCAVKAAVEHGLVSEQRYRNYLLFLDEVMAQERRY